MSVPVRVPVAVGVNVTITVQLAGEGPNELVQVPRVSAKSPVVPNEIGVGPVPVFFIVTVLDALVVPTACLANVSLVGVAVTTTVRAFPVPLRLTICGEVDPLSVTEIDPARVPVACGINVTEIVQVAGEGPSVVPHVFVCAKSPLTSAIEIGVDAVPVFFTVTVFAALVVPTVCAANVSLVGETVTTTVPALPVPVRLTVCGELLALSVIKIEPVSVPADSGVNVTLIVQLAGEAPSVGPQVVDFTAKSPLAGEIVIGVDPVPVFFTVTVLAALVVPIAWAAKVSLVGEGVTITVAALPVPVSFTICGELVALSVTESVPVRVPVVVGLNVTDMVQLAPAANVVPHGVVPPPTAAKSPVAANESEVDPVPVFFTVTVLAALVVPTV